MKKSATFPQLLSLKDLASPLAHQGTTIMVRMEVGVKKKTDLPVVFLWAMVLWLIHRYLQVVPTDMPDMF